MHVEDCLQKVLLELMMHQKRRKRMLELLRTIEHESRAGGAQFARATEDAAEERNTLPEANSRSSSLLL